jgi:hypothetical protein
MDYAKKEMFGLGLMGLIPLTVFIFSVMLLRMPLVGAAVFAMLAIVIMFFVVQKIMYEPLIQILKKKGLAVINIDSSGILKLYLAKVHLPYVTVETPRGPKSTVFDRRLLVQFLQPKTVAAVEKEDCWTLDIPKKDYGKNNFGWNGLNVFLWNDRLQSFVTKEMIADQETEITVDHAILHLNDRIHSLHMNMAQVFKFFLDTMLKKNPFANINFGAIILVILVIVILVLFNQPILDFLFGATGGLTSGISNAAANAPASVTKI